METDSEESDSDLSDVASLDSDLEKEQEKSYERSEVNSKAANLKLHSMTIKLLLMVRYCRGGSCEFWSVSDSAKLKIV